MASESVYLKLHRKNESLSGKGVRWDEIHINPRAVVSIMKHPNSGETWVSMGPNDHIVKETVEEVLQLLANRYKAWGPR